MSNSSLVSVEVPANANNYAIGRNGQTIEMITIHHMSGVLTAEECGLIFQDENRIASSHYGVGKDGRIGQYVDEENTAYTNGDLEANFRAVTIETSNSETSGNYPVSDEVLEVLIKLVADIAKRNNLGILVKGENLTWHSLYSKTSCPGEYLLSKIDYIIEQANKINSDEVVVPEEPSPEPTVPQEPVPEISDPEVPAENKKTDEEIANEVIKGDWGNGEDRKNKLNGAGYNYDTIQKLVNDKLKGNTLKSNEEIANEVIKGTWGNGEDRKNKLNGAGYNYDEIQKIVNDKLKGNILKTNEVIANEVIKGNWGNGEDRKTKLAEAGYDYNSIQKLVNEKLK